MRERVRLVSVAREERIGLELEDIAGSRPTPTRVPHPANAQDSDASLSGRSTQAQLDQLTIRQRLAHELNERKGRMPAVLDALHEKAERGDVPAARELRGWYDQGLGTQGQAPAEKAHPTNTRSMQT
jgi:hypothetical protein